MADELQRELDALLNADGRVIQTTVITTIISSRDEAVNSADRYTRKTSVN